MAAILTDYILSLKEKFKAGTTAEIETEGKKTTLTFDEAQDFINFLLTQSGGDFEKCKALVEGSKDKPAVEKKATKEETKTEK